MSDDLVKAAREAMDGVTAGPWESSADGGELPYNVMPRVYSADGTLLGEIGNLTLDQDTWEANARFIAAMRDLAPMMADRIEADAVTIADLTAKLKEAVGHLRGMCGAYEIICSDAGLHYHKSPSSKFAAANAFIAKHGGAA